MTHHDKAIITSVSQLAWDTVFEYVDQYPTLGITISGYIAQGAADGAERAAIEQLADPNDPDVDSSGLLIRP